MFFNESKNYFSESAIEVEATETGLTGDSAGAFRLVAESTEEWYNLREKMMRLEHVAIIKEDENLLSEGAEDFFKKIGDFFVKMLARVKEIWSKFVAQINNLVASDKQFVNRYGKILRDKTFGGFETKGHKWKDGDLGKDLHFDALLRVAETFFKEVQSVSSEDQVKSLRDKIGGADFADSARGIVLHGSDSKKVEGSSFAEEVRRSFMEGDKLEEVTLSGSDLKVASMLAIISETNANVKSAEKEQKAIEKLLSEAAKFYKGLAGRLSTPSADKKASSSQETKDGGHLRTHDVDGVSKSSKDGNHKVEIGGGQLAYKDNNVGYSDRRIAMRDAATVSAGACRQLSTVGSAAFGILIDGIKSRRSEYRSHLARMVSHKPADGAAKSESADFAAEVGASAGSILDRY